MTVLIIQHAGVVGPGLIAEYLQKKGKAMKIVYVPEQPVPDPTVHEALVILGGPQSVNEKKLYLRNERLMIRRALMLKKPVLGICMGAQLIASAAGAKVHANPVKEYGVFIAEATQEAKADRVFAYMGRRFPVFAWHAETFELPKGATLLARGNTCKNQAFSYKTAYGLQFHLETTKEMVRDWLAAYKSDIMNEGISPLELREEFAKSEEAMRELCMTFCSRFFR